MAETSLAMTRGVIVELADAQPGRTITFEPTLMRL